MNYYSHHIGDYRRDTAHLSLLEHGVYRQLLDMYYLSETKIPDETDLVYRRLCARSEEEKRAVDTVLAEFFKSEKGWVHTRCEKEISEYQGKAGRARLNGRLGGRPSKTKVVIYGNQENTDSKANHKPLTNNQEPVTSPSSKEEVKRSRAPDRPADVDEQVWKDWLQLRKAKKAPVTQTVLANAQTEAEKAGMSLQSFLQAWCARGSQGLQADWLKPHERGGGMRSESFRERDARAAADRVAEFAPGVAARSAQRTFEGGVHVNAIEGR